MTKIISKAPLGVIALLLILTACGLFSDSPTTPPESQLPQFPTSLPVAPVIKGVSSVPPTLFPSPTWVPTSTPRPIPTSTPVVAAPQPVAPSPTPAPPTATPVPTALPVPTATVAPVAIPKPTETPDPTPPTLPELASPDRDDIYITGFPLLGPDSVFPQGFYLTDGNINGRYQDPAKAPGYLEGPLLSVFLWEKRQSQNCPSPDTLCAPMATSDGFRNSRGITRPHWGDTQEQQRAATVYYRLTDMARNYFDPNNTISLALEQVPPQDKLVALMDQPGEPPCRNSCLRLHRQSAEYISDTRPDGRNEGTPYSQRPKLLLAETNGWQLETQAFLLGQYYHKVFLPLHGRGGGFPQFGEHQEKALDAALSNWYASDYTGNLYLAAWDPKRHDNPSYLWNSHPSIPFPRLGDVLTSALWRIHELPGTDNRKWRRTILGLVDRQTPEQFASEDNYRGVSIIRGFAHRAFIEATNSGVFNRAATRDEACHILVEHELLPASYGC